MSTELLTAIIAAVATIAAVGLPLFVQGRRTQKKVNPISNGFADNVTDTLQRLDERTRSTNEALLDHIQACVSWRTLIDLGVLPCAPVPGKRRSGDKPR